MLVGNHDAYYKDRSDVNSLSILNRSNNITIVSSCTTVDLFGRTVSFCPWGTGIVEVSPSDIIFGHFEIASFKQTVHRVCSSGEKVDDMLEKGKLIISGHFHLREEREYSGRTIIYLGNPYEMDFSDTGNIKGYYTLDVQSMAYKFNENKLSPTHLYVSVAEYINNKGISAEIAENISNNFVRVVVDCNITPDNIDNLLLQISTYKPASVTTDYKNNVNQLSINRETLTDMTALDIPTAIEDFIELMDVDNKKELSAYTVNLYKKCSL